MQQKKRLMLWRAGGVAPAPAPFDNTYSLDFDGVDEYVDLGNDSALYPGTGDASYSMWFKTDAVSGYQTIIAPTTVGTSTKGVAINLLGDEIMVFMGVGVGGQWGVNTGGGTGGGGFVTSGVNIAIGTWYHLAVTLDRDGDGVIYIDGSAVLTAAMNPNDYSETDITATFNINIGRNVGYFDGLIDEVSIFNTVLSASQVSDLYNDGLPTNLNSFEVTPEVWYRMGDSGTYFNSIWQIPDQMKVDNFSNYSMDFDGIDDFIDIGTTSLGITSAISVSAWVKIPTTNTGGGAPNIQVIVCEDTTGGTQRNWSLIWRHISSSNKYFAFSVFHTDGSATSIQSTGITPNDGEWHHLMGTFDGTTDANGLKLYVDGTLFQTTAGSTGIRSTSSVEPAIGALTSGVGWRLEGQIDDVAVFDAVKVVSDVSDGTKPIDCSADTDLVAYWLMGEGATFSTNWTIPDDSSNSNDGTSSGMAIDDRVTDAPDNENQANSVNMEEGDRSTDVPT